MNLSALARVHLGPGYSVASGSAFATPAWLRLMLLSGCAAAVALVALIGDPAAYLASDAELATLLRGMALIKAGIVLTAISALWWRLRRPVSTRLALVYLVGTWWMVAASMLIWQLTLIPMAALTFHVGEIALLLAAWRDWEAPRRTEAG